MLHSFSWHIVDRHTVRHLKVGKGHLRSSNLGFDMGEVKVEAAQHQGSMCNNIRPTCPVLLQIPKTDRPQNSGPDP